MDQSQLDLKWRSTMVPDHTDASETANLHLDVHGKQLTLQVPIRLGPATLLDMLPTARALTEQTTRIALEQVQAEGKQISCRAGCGACCRQLVAISVVEAQALTNLVKAMPAERQAVIRERFAQAVRRLEAVGLLDAEEPKGGRSLLVPGQHDTAAARQELARRYFQQGIACPFLEEESCSIHPDRPMVCREYHVTSPAEHCGRLFEVPVDRVEVPLHVVEPLARTAHRTAKLSLHTIPLVLALEWSEANGAALSQPQDGMTLFRTFMSEIDQQCEQAFAERETHV